MNILRKRALLGAVLAVAATATLALTPALATAATNTGTAAAASSAHVRDVCGPVAAGSARCLAEVRTDVHGGTGVRGPRAPHTAHTTGAAGAPDTTLPPGYGPAQLRSAYNLTTSGSATQTVALIDAGDDPSAEADLSVYRTTYGLPACTTANGCFHKVNQAGQTSPLPVDAGWGMEISLDLDMVSASCPDCKILLVEADDSQMADLAASVDSAVALGATEVSNSYGGTETNGIQAYEADYSHPGVAILASSGDSGYGIPDVPAVYSTVTAVGGTTLTPATNTRGWSETAWSGASSGCSAWINKPSWQTDNHCPGRMVADVSADADPSTGPAIYDTSDGDGGWLIVGGTSASSPFIAGVIALAGNPAAFPNASYLYRHTNSLNDIIGGSNAEFQTCGTDYMCNALKGYDGPTGLGTPNGIAAF